MTDDHTFMRRALALAETRLGRTWPNPSVGCVIVKNGEVIGEGVTGDGGRPHGEEIALSGLGEAARDAVVYLVLEPCARRSAGNESCTDRLIAAGVKRVVIAAGDPHPNAGGAGVRKLKAAGVQVESGLCQAEGEALNAGFFSRVTHKAPIVCADEDRTRYDSAFAPLPGEEYAAALARLASIGLTRLCVAPGSELAVDLDQRKLLTPPFRLSP